VYPPCIPRSDYSAASVSGAGTATAGVEKPD